MTSVAIRSARSSSLCADLHLLWEQIRYEQRIYWRNPAAAFFTFAFPLVFFFILTGIAGSSTDAQDLGKGVHLSQYYTPSILAYAVMSACFLSLTMGIVRKREAGILKRYRGTPLPTSILIGGFIGSSMVVALLLGVFVIGAAVLFFGVHLPASHLLPIAVLILVAALAFCALGIAVSSLIPNDDSGPAVVNLPFFILVFISGTYFPVSGTLAKVAGYFPLRPLTKGMFNAFNPYYTGSIWSASELKTLLIWGVVATVFAVRRFRWLPRR